MPNKIKLNHITSNLIVKLANNVTKQEPFKNLDKFKLLILGLL